MRMRRTCCIAAALAFVFAAQADVIVTANEVVEGEVVGADADRIRFRTALDEIRTFSTRDIEELRVDEPEKAEWLVLVLSGEFAAEGRVGVQRDAPDVETGPGRFRYLVPEAGYDEMADKCRELTAALSEFGTETAEQKVLLGDIGEALDALARREQGGNLVPFSPATAAGCLVGFSAVAIAGNISGRARDLEPNSVLGGIAQFVLTAVTAAVIGIGAGCCSGALAARRATGEREHNLLARHLRRVNALARRANQLFEAEARPARATPSEDE